MKRFFALFMAFVIMLTATAAFGSVQDFQKFTADVPDNWTATEDGATVVIIKDDNTASISVTIDNMEEVSLKDLADAYIEVMDGTNLTMDDESYIFDAVNPNGVETKCFLSGDGTNYSFIVITGIDNAPEEVEAIINSMQEK